MSNFYFIGVSTGQSAINRVFPKWCRMVGRDVRLIGLDLPVGTPGATCRDAIARIRDDADAAGGLVTTHKVGVMEFAGDLFDEFGEDARLLGEVSCISRRGSKWIGDALDAVTAGGALRQITPAAGRDVLILGAGGAGTALALHLEREGGSRVHATDVSATRLATIARFGARTHLVRSLEENDEVLARMPPATMVVNATGLGKDLPGSPLTDGAAFPAGALAWDLNYRGDLQFLKTARRAGIPSTDGWDCFLRGWSLTMSRVLEFDLTPELFEAFREAAAVERPLRD